MQLAGIAVETLHKIRRSDRDIFLVPACGAYFAGVRYFRKIALPTGISMAKYFIEIAIWRAFQGLLALQAAPVLEVV